jgi:hypothetical protein
VSLGAEELTPTGSSIHIRHNTHEATMLLSFTVHGVSGAVVLVITVQGE